jgi:hypothetical protein
MKEKARTMAVTMVSVQATQPADSLDHISSARGVPVHNWRAHWLTVAEFSRMMGREPQTVYTWLRNGTLAEFGIPVYHFRFQGLHRGRAFIQNIY